jgi:MFS family permease
VGPVLESGPSGQWSIYYSLRVGVGLTLTQVSAAAAYAGCNAITRPINGHVVDRLGHRWISYGGFPVPCALMMFIPLFTGFGSILAVYMSAGVLRAVVIVANAVGLVQDVDEARVRRGVASGIYNAAGDLGNVLGPTIGGLIAAATSVSGVFIVAPVGSTVLFLFSMWAIRAAQNRSSISPTVS